jgi:hypothetical protein
MASQKVAFFSHLRRFEVFNIEDPADDLKSCRVGILRKQ